VKLHLLTVGQPKLQYAKLGWNEYLNRLQKLHQVRVTHLPDKHAYDSRKINEAVKGTYTVALEITGQILSSPDLANFLRKRELDAKEVSFMIGGPEGLPQDIKATVDFRWSFSNLTLPHDLAMVTLVESLYRASTINTQLPYHK
jgi:23S rRNA (pseudouridine1915-N3)-methyltransferase